MQLEQYQEFMNDPLFVDYLIEIPYSSVPTHKGAYFPVRTKKDVYNLTCNPKNYDHDLASKIS